MHQDGATSRFRRWERQSPWIILGFAIAGCAGLRYLVSAFVRFGGTAPAPPDVPPPEVGVYGRRMVVTVPALELSIPDGWTVDPGAPEATVILTNPPTTFEFRVRAVADAGAEDDVRALQESLLRRTDVTVLDQGAASLSFYAADRVSYVVTDATPRWSRHWFRDESGYRLHVRCDAPAADAEAAAPACESLLDRLSRR